MDKQQIIEKLKLDLQLRGYTSGTVKEYSARMQQFLEYFKKPADKLGEHEIRQYLYYLKNDRNLSVSTVNLCNSAIRFLFEVTLEQNLNHKRIPRLKNPIVLPYILTGEEVQAILDAAYTIKEKCILMVVYGSGLRVSEAAALKISNIDSKNMRILVEQGKPQLSPPYRVDYLLGKLSEEQWETICWRNGSKGPLQKQFAFIRARWATRAKVGNKGFVIFERPVPGDTGDIKYYFSDLPEETPKVKLVEYVHRRHTIENFYKDAKQ